ncbi:TPA: hypothetical protein DCX16_01475 [bacterium]|nr:hypothetical protein [bacterium]
MKKIFLFIFYLLLGNAWGSGGEFILGRVTYNLDELNTRLKNHGFKSLNEACNIIGGGGYYIYNEKILVGGHGGGFTQETENATYTTIFSGGHGFFDIGYVFSKEKVRIIPIFGIGGGGVSLSITPKNIKSDFDDVLKDPRQEANLSAGNILFNLGIMVNYLLRLGRDEKTKGGLLFTLRGGYMFSPSKSKWYLLDKEVSGSPKIDLSSPYIYLGIGGGSY